MSSGIHTHPENATAFAKDKDRMKWHDETLWYVRTKRDVATKKLPEWEELRQMGSDIKRHTLSKLDEYLVQFEENCKKNNITVHFAPSPEDHNNIVLELLQKHNVKKIVKSKSMLTEECHLNPFLEKHGMEVIDTDLGERIVQLRHEPPSHIVLPAIHTKKEDISELFHKKLGTEKGNIDPTYLTRAARADLRKRFLEADAGITGVNFAIAETGGIVTCTNEGNADIGTALPPLHIACMGMEKLIPKMEHLGVFTRLLARSATGQAITTYTSHFHGPRPGAEMHIVILDNGRTRMMSHKEHQRSLNCIRCGACMNTCPIYRRSGGHSYDTTVPGPIGSILAPNQDTKKNASLPFACTLCGSCTDVCPVKIDLHSQLYAWRRKIAEQGHLPVTKSFSMKIAGKVFSSPGLYKMAGKALKLGRFMPRALIYTPLNVWGKEREIPEIPKESFRDLLKKHNKEKK